MCGSHIQLQALQGGWSYGSGVFWLSKSLRWPSFLRKEGGGPTCVPPNWCTSTPQYVSLSSHKFCSSSLKTLEYGTSSLLLQNNPSILRKYRVSQQKLTPPLQSLSSHWDLMPCIAQCWEHTSLCKVQPLSWPVNLHSLSLWWYEVLIKYYTEAILLG